MVSKNTVARNYSLLAATVLVGLTGVACRWTGWGVLFVLPLAAAMIALGYLVSYYLNAIVDSSHRATVLSFKGLAFNLGYGFISLAFAFVLRAVRDGDNANEAIGRGLAFLPVWLLFACFLCAFCFRRHKGILSKLV